MPAAIEAAYKERGYFGIGGEYLLPLLFVLIVAAVSEARDMFQEFVATLKEKDCYAITTKRSSQNTI